VTASESVTFHVRNGIAQITLNRPKSSNALDAQAVRALLDIANACEVDPTVRVVLLRGSGRNFCAGGDTGRFLKELENGTLQAFSRQVAADFHLAISRLLRLDSPLIVAVQGAAAGAGLSLVCAADLVIAADDVRLCTAYPALGLTMDGGLSYFLPRIVGRRRALELALTNRVLRAPEALALGVVTEVVTGAELNNRAEELASQLAAGPTRAYGDIKRLLDDGWQQTLETQLEREARALFAAFGSRDGREGILAFAAKRAPVFVGS
jgi:2-(1,2-epoxy-1,2-dihydrophenyl)acetyl-CoA isomerase